MPKGSNKTIPNWAATVIHVPVNTIRQYCRTCEMGFSVIFIAEAEGDAGGLVLTEQVVQFCPYCGAKLN
jgi:hypothetical protein